MSKASIKDIMYLFKGHNFVIWYDNGNSASYVMNWDECWKYCRKRNLLATIPSSCYIDKMTNHCISINL